jgi:hypothetical protein
MTTLEALPPQHPLATVLRSSRDARNADALADALLNPRDRAYTVPQLLDLVDRAGLRFGRWYRQAPYLPQCGAIAATPHAARLAAQPEREQFAALELWRGMMTTHSAILCRSEFDGAARVGFDGDAWRRYVPHRLPWTELLRHRLPPGADGALLNRSHTFPDLVLLLDAWDLRLFEGIDGRRSLADIAEWAGEPDDDRVAPFFETLWRYDQVVFDASEQGFQRSSQQVQT